ncbi:MAG: hypothetical protein SF187_13305 [Deltaproteobacteria bacterium]|nr:hypothetical protein [Deltaproteobacteria bacterium]
MSNVLRGVACAGLGWFMACATAPKAPPPTAPPPAKTQAPATPMQEEGAPNLRAALAALEKAEADALVAPNDVAAWSHLTVLLRQAYRTQEAARAAWHAVELESSFATWTNLGNVLAQGDVFMSMGGAMGAFQAFKMAAREAKAKEPARVDAASRNFLNLSYRDLQMGHDDQALELIALAEALTPQMPLVHYDKARVLAASDRQVDAKTAAQKSLDLIAALTPNQTPTDASLAQVQKAASELVQGKPASRPPLDDAGETLPERFWEKPPERGQALNLQIDRASARFIPLVPGIAMRLQTPTNWAHSFRATDKAVHLRMASPAGEGRFLVQITLFPVARENFNLKEAAVAGRHGAQAPDTEVGPLLPLERKDGLAFYFEAVDNGHATRTATASPYKHLVQLFAYARPFVFSATLLSKRPDDEVKDAMLEMIRSFEIFRVEP